MDYVFLYLTGILFGLIIRYVYKIHIKHKEKTDFYNNILFANFRSCHMCYEKEDDRNYRKRIIIRTVMRFLFILIIVSVLLVFIVLIIKYGLLIKIKSIAIHIFNLLKDIFLFLFGLCTPYLTERMTKRLRKIKKNIKKRKKKKKIKKYENI